MKHHDKATTPATAHATRTPPISQVPTSERDPTTALLQVREIAGNQGLERLLAQRQVCAHLSIQRMTTTAKDLDRLMGRSNTRSVGGVGASTYAKISKTLADYEAEKLLLEAARSSRLPNTQRFMPSQKRMADMNALLERLEGLCLEWINTHKGPQDQVRRAKLTSLADELAVERSDLSRKQADEIWLDSAMAGRRHVSGQGKQVPESYPHKFQATYSAVVAAETRAGHYTDLRKTMLDLDPEKAKKDWVEKLEDLRRRGITPAEEAAIRMYTIESTDYGMMNAGAARDEKWMMGHRIAGIDKYQNRDFMNPDLRLKTMMEEGALHTSMAVSGLRKLDPFRGGPLFRGVTITKEEFDTKIVAGETAVIPHLTSSSVNVDTATGFYAKNLSEKRPIALLWKYSGSGEMGRELGWISEVSGEGEVILLPGARFKIVAVKALPDTLKYKTYQVDAVPLPPDRPRSKAPASRGRPASFDPGRIHGSKSS